MAAGDRSDHYTHRPRTRSEGPWPVGLRFRPWAPCQLRLRPDLSRVELGTLYAFLPPDHWIPLDATAFDPFDQADLIELQQWSFILREWIAFFEDADVSHVFEEVEK